MSKKIFMLFISAILVLSLSMINCTNVGKGGPDGHDKEKVEPGHEGHDHAPGEGHGEDDGHDHSGAQGSYRVLHIETDIIKKWGIQYTSPEPRDFTEKIELTGVAKENMDTSFMINARVGGTVESVKKDIGDNVKKNDILCTLNSSELLEKKTDYIKAFQEYIQMKASHDRTTKLFKINAIEKKEMISRESAYKTAMAEFFSLEAELITIGYSKSQLKKVKKDLMEDREEKLKDFLTPFYHIPAPAAGKIMTRNLHLGEPVETSKTLFEVTDTRKLWLILDANEKDLPYIEKGKEVEVETDVYPDKFFNGKVLTLMEKIDPQLRTFKVRVEVENPNGLLKPEMYVTGKLKKKVDRQYLSVPEQSLVKVSNADGVFVITGDGFQFRPVQVLDVDWAGFAFVKGLKADDMVITTGSFYLKAEHEIQSGTADPHAGHSH